MAMATLTSIFFGNTANPIERSVSSWMSQLNLNAIHSI